MRIRFNSITGNMLMQEQLLMKKIEFAQIKKQIEILASFVPDEILKLRRNEWNQIQTYVGVLLLVNVTGITLLTERYNKAGVGGIYKLTATLNAYIGAIVETLQFYGGDVLKFTGNSILALWKVLPDESLFEILHVVVVCALVIQQSLGQFDTEVNVQLTVKVAISCGNMSFAIIGYKTKQFVIVGDAIFAVKECERIAQTGDVVISPGAWAHMLQERYEVTSTEGGNVKVWKVFYKPNESAKKMYFDEKHMEVLKLIDKHINHRNELHAKRKFDSSLSDSKITEQFIRSLPPRAEIKLAPRHWIVDDLRPFIIKPVHNQVDESQPVEYLTEMREVTIQYINIIPSSFSEMVLILMINKAFQLISDIVGEYLGVVNKVTFLYDKYVMILVLFGLRGINHEMEGQNALRSAFKIKTVVEEIRGVKTVSVSVTHGLVYCGVIGHPMRREYSVIGGAVNKAVRMMVGYPEIVTCDHKTFKHSKLSSFYFQLQPVIKVKGIEDPGNIFEYNEDFDNAQVAASATLPIIGRDEEYNLLAAIIKEPGSVHGFYGICLHGPSKIGKTAIIRAVLESAKETKSLNVASIELEGSSNIPYFCISKIYRQLYDNRAKVNSDDISIIINLPRDLWDRHEEMENSTDDIALQKYRILNYFRDIILFSNDKPCVVFIDNVEHVDLQSWEILEIVFNCHIMALIMAASFEESNWDLKFKMSINDHIKLLELRPLKVKHIPTLACQFLETAGIPAQLGALLKRTCEGRPGFVQSCLLRLINNESIELKFINKSEKDETNFVYPPEENIGVQFPQFIIPVADFSEKYKYKNDELTLARISLDLFDSFTPFQQLVIKTGSVLGDIFTRSLLIVALKYPSEHSLAKAIQILFEEEVFDCGSRFVYANEIETMKNCCRCFFPDEIDPEADADAEGEILPKYAYCKIIHFKNKSIKDVAYGLLPGNQKRELHLLCTEVIENMNNHCPKCLREPANNFITFGKFKEIMEYCNNPHMPYNITACEYGNYDNMKECIRKATKFSLEKKIKKKKSSARPVYDPKLCNCFEILCRVYKDLMYHSGKAKHLGKQIFFTLKYGLVLICMHDIVTGISVLTEARELCLIDCKLASAQISETFRRYHVGKIELSLAGACMDLRQLKSAKNHLAIALRQYNVPSLSFSFKHCRFFLTKNFLINTQRLQPVEFKNTLSRAELSRCLGMCGRLFSLEGNWAYAKLSCAYSVYLIKTINVNIPILFDIYTNAIDIYKYCNDMHTCEKLQKYVAKEVQLNYANNITLNMYSLLSLLYVMFEVRVVAGEICSAIRLGYRVLDLKLKIFTDLGNNSIMIWLGLILIYNFRFKDYYDLCRMYKRNFNQNDTKYALMYYSANMCYYILTGFIIEPLQDILDFANNYYGKKTSKHNWEDHLFRSVIHLHYMRLEMYQVADNWKYDCTFNAYNINKDIVLKTLFFTLEAKFLSTLRKRRNLTPQVATEQKVLKALLKLVKEKSVKQYKIFQPWYLCLMAWNDKLNGKHRNAARQLNQCYKLCEKQENVMYMCFVRTLRNCWGGGFVHDYKSRPMTTFLEAVTFKQNDWAQFLHPYLLN